MYPLLLAAGILLLVLLGRREHLAFTETIKDVRNTADQAEQDRIFAMAPASLQTRARAVDPDRFKMAVVHILRDFQAEVYVSATTPVTEAVIDAFVASKRAYYRATPTALRADFYTEAYTSGDAKRLLMTYFNVRPAGTVPPLSSVPSSSTSPTASVPQMLEQMRDNLLEYKMTGDPRYKSAYTGIKAWMDQYVASLNTRLQREADSISAEVARYRTANADLADTQAEFQQVRRDGPALENAYLTIKRQVDEVPEPDLTSFYVKVGIAGALVVGAIVVSLV
jgi:hypothetical protein